LQNYERQEAAFIALAMAGRGENDVAFGWFEKVIQYQDPHLARINVEARLMDSPIQKDPRCLSFLERIGMSTAQLDAIEFNVELPE
jgi:homoaconitase/3-isopropylmalate dehydratase large subunit